MSPAELLRHPLLVAPANLRLMGDYLVAYLTLPLCLVAVAALAYQMYRRSAAALVLVSASVLPLPVQVFVLQKLFPTRFPFPTCGPGSWCWP